MRPVTTNRLTRRIRTAISNSTNKETDVNTPVPIIMMPAVAAVAIQIGCIQKGIRFARSLPATIAGCVVALHVADILPLRNLICSNLLCYEGHIEALDSNIAGILYIVHCS
jgi:hypothetical protein